MTDSEDTVVDTQAAAAPPGVGPQLRAARERKGLTLDQMAAETRISRRNLELIEAGDFNGLASRTYAVGFAKTYAKVVALDQEDVAAMVRAEMDEAAADDGYSPAQRGTFEPGDPNRSPGGGLLWFSIFAIVVLLVGIFFAARALFSPAAEMPSLIEQEEAAQGEEAAATVAEQTEPAAPVDTDAAVVFTATGETWVRFYDGNGLVLQEGVMQAGDSFTIPASAQNPQINTGRPDLLEITIGGQEVPKLSETLETLQDVPISAEALMARTWDSPTTIGFGMGTAAGPPAAAAPAPQATRTAASSPAPAATTERRVQPTASPAATPSPSAAPPATPSPSAAATLPPRAAPADEVSEPQ